MLCTGNQSEMAHKWAKWQHHPSLLGGPQCSTCRSNLKWPTSGQSGYITPASWGSPMLCKGANLRDGLQVGKAATSALPSSGSPMLCTGNKSEMAHKWAKRQHHPFGLGVPQCSARGSKLKWPTSGQSGYITPAFWGVPNALHGEKLTYGPEVGKAATSPLPSGGPPMLCTGNKSEMAQKWAKWQHHPCLLGGPECSSQGTNLKWPTSGQSGYITAAFSGVPNALHGEKCRYGPQVGKAATSPLPSRGSTMLCTGI